MSRPVAVEIAGLHKRFGALEAVQPLSLEIFEGETLGLLGPNGAGKTTTLSMLATLLVPSGGDMRIFGESLAEGRTALRGQVGLAPQEIALYPDLSAEENLLFFARLYGVAPPRARERAGALLERVGLTPRKGDRVHTYSGGMQRRLNLACALVHEPRLVLLDEPTAGVDPQSRENLLRTVRSIAADGTTVVYTTHYMEEAERICDRILILDQGRMLALGTLEELLEIVGLGEVIELREAEGRLDLERLGALPDVLRVETSEGTVRLVVGSSRRVLAPLAALLAEAELERVEVYRVNLERVFMHLTGHGLRD